MKAVFHIGRPKTGSTTLQVFLQRNRDALAEQGFLYKRADPKVSSQWEFALAALSQREQFVKEANIRRSLGLESRADQDSLVKTRLDMLTADLEGAPDNLTTWIASSEHAFPMLRRRGLIRAFNKTLKGYFDQVDYVVYLRRQEDLVPSAYAEAVRRGETMDFEDYIALYLEKDRGNHWERLERWLQVVGPERLHVGLLERDALTDGDLISDFCRVCAIDDTGLTRPDDANQGLSMEGIDKTLMLNRNVASKDTKSTTRWKIRSKLQSKLEVTSGGDDRLRLPQAGIEQVRAHFAQSNENVRAAFFPDRAELFPPRQVETPA